jgi:hypothetical protein
MGRADKVVIAHMRDNGGVLTRSQALALGMPSSTLQEWVEVGHLTPVGRGIYVLPGILDSEPTLLRAATARLDAVVSHESAARLHGVEGLDPSRFTVSVPVRRSNRFPGVYVHQLTDLLPEHTRPMFQMSVTNPTRTIIDLAAVLPEHLLAQCLDQGVRMRLTSYERVAEMVTDLARKGKPGIAKLRKILEVRLGREFVSESVMETRIFGIIVDAGLPLPTTQFRPVWLRKINGRLDLAYVPQEILIEADSLRFHGTPEAFQADRTRDNLAQLSGWMFLRYTWEDVTKRPEMIVEQIRQALSIRARAGYPSPEH